MTELDIKNQRDKRVLFHKKGSQKIFLEKIQNQLGFSSKVLARFIGVHVRSLSDWKREKYSMSLSALQKLCQKTRLPIPDNIKIEDRFWYVYKGGEIGGRAVYEKYGRIGGEPGYRKKKWCEWWEKEGKFKKHPIINVCLPISIPKKSSELAELIGIILGDGGISAGQVTITLNMYTDRLYSEYVKSLFKRLFSVNPSVYERSESSTLSIVVSRSILVKFLIKNGLKIGGKVRQQVGVPPWVQKSNSNFKSCLRGLFDTDGCFYVDKHKYKDKVYSNAGMNFTNRSLPILRFFENSLKRLGFHPTRKKFSILLRKEKEIFEYFNKIGSSNHKHSDKFERYLKTIQGGVG